MPEVIFNGPDGRLEGRYHHGADENPPVALVLHPHPQHGGSMNNKVVYALYRTFTQMDFSVLRFNFRGVGRSQGAYDEGTGELSDAASALDWLQSYNPDARACWITGFSFGAWIRSATLDEAAGNHRIRHGRAAGQHLRLLIPCPLPGVGPDHPGYDGHARTRPSAWRNWLPNCRASVTWKSIINSLKVPTISSMTIS